MINEKNEKIKNTILIGDFNIKVGKGRYENKVGDNGLGFRNGRGDCLVKRRTIS